MALISSYPDYLPVNDLDRWIGTNSTNGSTRNFTAQQIADYLNLKAKIMIGGQMSYQYDKDTAIGTIGKMFNINGVQGVANVPFNTITTFDISTLDLSDEIVTQFFQYLIGSNILIGEGDAISNFGHYTLDTLTQIGLTPFYTATVTYLGGNGNLLDDQIYTIFQFDTLSTTVSPTFTFVQAAAATVWNIPHNLGKFPSVSIINNNSIVINGEVTYIDNNNVTLNFSAGFSGTAYLN